MKYILFLICLRAFAADVIWDANPEAEGITNYTVKIYSITYGTNVTIAVGTNTSVALPPTTNGVWNIIVKADNDCCSSKWSKTLRIVNVPLNVPNGKFYIERGVTTSVWLSSGTITGPTTLWFPANQQMGFFRFRPYFVSAVNPKSAKLVKVEPVEVKTAAPLPPLIQNPFVGPVNLDPASALK